MSVYIRNSSTPTVDIDLTNMPAKGDVKGSRPLSVFLIFFGLFFAAMGGSGLIAAKNSNMKMPPNTENYESYSEYYDEYGEETEEYEEENELEIEAIIICSLFSAVGLGIILFGLNELTRRKEISIDKNFVSVNGKSLFGKTDFMESLKNYQGVLHREVHVRNKNHSYTIYFIELHHTDKKKTIELYVTQKADGIRKRWEDTARMLNLPALEKSGSDIISRDAEDLDKSIKELVEEGKLRTDYNPLEAVPNSFSINKGATSLTLTILKKRVSFGAWIFLLVPLGIAWVAWSHGEYFPVIICFIMFCIFLFLLAFDATSNRIIFIDRENIHAFTKGLLYTTSGKNIPLNKVESIEIGENRGNGINGRAVLIKSDYATIGTAENMNKDDQEWLRSFLINAVAKN